MRIEVLKKFVLTTNRSALFIQRIIGSVMSTLVSKEISRCSKHSLLKLKRSVPGRKKRSRSRKTKLKTCTFNISATVENYKSI